MGFNPYKIEESSVDDVRAKFAEKKKAREELLLKARGLALWRIENVIALSKLERVILEHINRSYLI